MPPAIDRSWMRSAPQNASTESRPWPTNWRSTGPATPEMMPTLPKRSRTPSSGHLTVPTTVHAEVTSGWVNLTGEVDWSYQRDDAFGIVQGVMGVMGVTNLVTLKPTTSPVGVEDKIRDAFERNADLDADGLSVTGSGGKGERSG